MAINKLQIGIAAILLSGGLALGLHIKGEKSLAITVGVSSVAGIAIGSGGVAAFYQRKIKKVIEENKAQLTDLDKEKQAALNDLKTAQQLHSDTARLRDKAVSEVGTIQSELAQIKADLKIVKSNNERTTNDYQKAEHVISELNRKIEYLQDKVANQAQAIEDKEAELEEFNNQYDSNLAKESEIIFQQRKRETIAKEIQTDREITEEALALLGEYQTFLDGVMDKHYYNAQLTQSTNDTAKNHIQNMVISHNQALSDADVHINQLEAQLKASEMRNAGELLAPELIRDKQGKQFNIANYIANELWENYQIALKLHGVTETESGFKAGYGYSNTVNRDYIAQIINENREQWKDLKGIHAINAPHLPKHLPAIEVIFTIDRPPVLKDDDIYRFLERSEAFGQIIRDAQNHRKGGKPTLRIMSGTGGGKSLVGKVIIQEYCNKERDYEIWLSDPLDGSEQDYWNTPKAATNKQESHKLFLDFANEHKSRKNKQSQYSDQKLLALFDEFDKQHSKDDKELAAEIWTAIRHTKQRLILFGQSAEVGKTGWTWDEMNNCSMLFLGDGIATAIKHYKDIGFSVKYKNQLQRQWDEIKPWLKDKNEGLDAAKRYRVGMLVVGEDARFLLLPPALIEPVVDGKSWVVSQPFQNYNDKPDTDRSTTVALPDTDRTLVGNKPKLQCSRCGSNNISSKADRYICDDCGKQTRKHTGKFDVK